MAIEVIAFYIVVVVLPILSAVVVGRVDLDGVHPSSMRVSQRLENMVVLTVDDDVVRFVSTTPLFRC